jgi:hypothetical protein
VWPRMARYPTADTWCKCHVRESSKGSKHVVSENVKIVAMQVTHTAHSSAVLVFLAVNGAQALRQRRGFHKDRKSEVEEYGVSLQADKRKWL